MRNYASLHPALLAATLLMIVIGPGRALAVEQQQLDAFTRDALQRAYEDTHASRAFYAAVIARHGNVDPFVGVLEGEARQERALKALAKANQVDVSAGAALPKQPGVPGTVKGACSAAVDVAKHSVAFYDEVMANVKNSAIRANFENYREAAAAHQLPAFERCVARGGGTPPVSNTGSLPDSKNDGPSPQPNGAASAKTDSGVAADSSTGRATASVDGASGVNDTVRCESCGMAGCGCDQGGKTAESAGHDAAAAASSSTAKPGAQHTCGCMREKTNQ